jgi:hypothetical protein
MGRFDGSLNEMREKFSSYQQVAILIPGAVFILGLIILVPDLRSFFSRIWRPWDHLARFICRGACRCCTRKSTRMRVVGNAGRNAFQLGDRAGAKITSSRPDKAARSPHSCATRYSCLKPTGSYATRLASDNSQLYRDVLANNPGRIETFNGNYGLNRGLGAGLLALAALFGIVPPHRWTIALCLGTIALVYFVRMDRFGRYFAREVLTGFFNLPSTTKSRAISQDRRDAKSAS